MQADRGLASVVGKEEKQCGKNAMLIEMPEGMLFRSKERIADDR